MEKSGPVRTGSSLFKVRHVRMQFLLARIPKPSVELLAIFVWLRLIWEQHVSLSSAVLC